LMCDLTVVESRDARLPGQLIVFNDPIVDRAAIDTAPTLGPHLSEAASHIQQVIFQQEPLTTRATHTSSFASHEVSLGERIARGSSRARRERGTSSLHFRGGMKACQ